jgi:hypothetical protein
VWCAHLSIPPAHIVKAEVIYEAEEYSQQRGLGRESVVKSRRGW